jgi:hypothetical protein
MTQTPELLRQHTTKDYNTRQELLVRDLHVSGGVGPPVAQAVPAGLYEEAANALLQAGVEAGAEGDADCCNMCVSTWHIIIIYTGKDTYSK